MLPLVVAGAGLAARTAAPYIAGWAARAMAPTAAGIARDTVANIVMKKAGIDLPPITPGGGVAEGLSAVALNKDVYREGVDKDMAAAIDAVRGGDTTSVLTEVADKRKLMVPLNIDGTINFKATKG